ncbi:MAG: hypothetical protein AAGC93_10375 [Cyanobacteria bacterium P01_F01_bin.53]
MPLSTRVRRFSLSQWRYYYNQLLFIDAPLTATFIQGLMPLTGSSPTVEIEPITANDHQPSEALDAISEEPSLETLSPKGLNPSEWADDEVTFDELPLLPLAPPLTPKRLNQTPVLNIYSDRLLNRGENSDRNIVVELAFRSTIATTNPIHINIADSNTASSRQGPALNKFVTQSMSAEFPKIEIPAAMCKVSNLLASFVTQ